jgi:hypothetical protein
MRDRRRQLRDAYGFDFPDDLFRFWDFVNRLRPLEPLLALQESLHITLVGPFEVLAGRFDRHTPRLSQHLHWRYYLDPPEFFTVLAGDTDGLHWGYYLDDPPNGLACVASYYAHDAFEMTANGDDLFQAVRLELEYRYRDCLEYRDEDPDQSAVYEAVLSALNGLRSQLRRSATRSRTETGDAYIDRYAGRNARKKRVVAATQEGMGIVLPERDYRPLPLRDKKLWRYLWEEEDPADVVEAARHALQEGFPGTALKLGKDLWAVGGEKKGEYAYELLEAAYAALGRDLLREVLRTHRENRGLPSVDILENEQGE